MLMRQAALVAALAAAGQAAFDACGEPTKGPVLGGIDIVDAWAKALKARNATAPSQGPRLPHMAEAPPLRGSAEHAFTTQDGFALHFATEANRDAYAADPAKYPLGAGGYCGLGASGRDPRCPEGGHCRGPACGTSPLTFQISGVDGKLYFFLGAGARQIFNEDEKASVAGASSPPAPAPDDDDAEAPPPSLLVRLASAATGWVASNYFLVGMLSSVALASLCPGLGATGGPLRPEITVNVIAVRLMFLISGFNLPTSELRASVANVRANALIQSFVFGVAGFVVAAIV